MKVNRVLPLEKPMKSTNWFRNLHIAVCSATSYQ